MSDELEKLLGYWLCAADFKASERMRLKGEYGRLRAEYDFFDRGYSRRRLQGEYQSLEAGSIGLSLPGDPIFDRVFGAYADRPCGLFYKGDLGLIDTDCVTFAGSRQLSAYGEGLTRELVRSLGGLAVTIVSGGARGADSVAHRQAIASGLKTICVLGCGVNYAYPPENRELFETIIQNGGLLLSEYLPERRPEKYFFPERNRIMAQLGSLIVIPEASATSGSLHTALCADEYGKILITVPHDIHKPNGQGCNMLIASGAQMLLKASDLKDYLL